MRDGHEHLAVHCHWVHENERPLEGPQNKDVATQKIHNRAAVAVDKPSVFVQVLRHADAHAHFEDEFAAAAARWV